MTSELSEVEEILLEVMTKIQHYTNNTSSLNDGELKEWYKCLNDAKFLVKDLLADEADKFDLCD